MNNTIKPVLIDSHCHLQSIDLSLFDNSMDNVCAEAYRQGVEKMLCVCIELEDLPCLYAFGERYPHIFISVGIHPNTVCTQDIDEQALVTYANHSKCIAIGETGLDYYRCEPADQDKQQERFRQHIRASITTKKPLIIHTRQAAEDTIKIMREEQAEAGVIHCFTETWDVAKQALDMGFYISFSGIVSFKNAQALQEVAKKIPMDRLLIETDSPYLAPVPYRGKQNHPALVKYVAIALGEIRGETFATIARKTTENFYECFMRYNNK